MLGTAIKDITCDVCGSNLYFEYEETFDAFKDSADLTTTNLFETIDSIIDKYLVFSCHGCNIKYRYTYKDIDKIIRNTIFKKLLLLIAQGQIVRDGTHKEGVLIYCGKCTGYDGQGSCLRSVFNKCNIKKFPAR